MKSYTLERYYAFYLKNLGDLSETSQKNYIRGLNKVSSLLVEKGMVNNSLYELGEWEDLMNIKDFLKSDIDFLDLDKRGHRMYSVAFNHYCRFASGKGVLDDKKIELMDIALSKKEIVTIESKQWKRSSIIKRQSIIASGYACELDSNHQTFIAEKTKKPYMEGHHIIPMRHQGKIDASLDVYANILCLCPICHRLMHYGEKSIKEKQLENIYFKRFERLRNSGIKINKDEFKKLAM